MKNFGLLCLIKKGCLAAKFCKQAPAENFELRSVRQWRGSWLEAFPSLLDPHFLSRGQGSPPLFGGAREGPPSSLSRSLLPLSSHPCWAFLNGEISIPGLAIPRLGSLSRAPLSVRGRSVSKGSRGRRRSRSPKRSCLSSMSRFASKRNFLTILKFWYLFVLVVIVYDFWFSI